MGLVNSVLVFGCLFVASCFMFDRLVWLRFYDSCNKGLISNRWYSNNQVGKLGGVGFFILFILIMFLWQGPIIQFNNAWVCFWLWVLFIVGIVDDLINVSWVKRLILYTVISTSIGVVFKENYVQWIVYSFIIMFFINSFNMLDNMNLIGVFTIFQVFICSAFITGDYRLVLFCVLIIPFLFFNWRKKLMMGDCGSTVIGAIFGILILYMLSNSVSVLSTVLIFCVPIADTCFVLTRRLIERRPLYIGGIDHLTHSLARMLDSELLAVIILVLLFGFGFGISAIGLYFL